MIGRVRKPRPSGKSFVGIFAVVLFIAAVFGVDYVTHGAIRTVVRQTSVAVYSAGDSAVAATAGSGFFSSRANLQSQIDGLNKKLALYQEKAAGYEVLVQENAALKKLTHFATSTQGISAPIDSALGASPYGTFLIGAGANDGISKGDLVLSGEGFVIGDISDVSAHTALVDELFAPARKTIGIVNGASVTIVGRGGENAHADVPHGVPVTAGDAVFVPSLNERPVGIIGEVSSSSASAYSDAVISLPVNLNELTYVYVVPRP